MKPKLIFLLLLSVAVIFTPFSAASADDPLPSWSEGKTKKAITGFVKDVTTDGGSAFVPSPERIAVFDNDGTLWAEQPMYVQIVFALDRVEALAAKHPQWKTKQLLRRRWKGMSRAFWQAANAPCSNS